MATIDMTTEIYKIIPENNHYSVSNFGHVKQNSTGRLLSIRTKKGGDTPSLLCTLRTPVENGRGKENVFRIAKLVADAFVPNPKEYKFVGLRDGNYANCRADNIYYKSAPNIHTEDNVSTRSSKSSKSALPEDEAKLLREFREKKAAAELETKKIQRRFELEAKILELRNQIIAMEAELAT